MRKFLIFLFLLIIVVAYRVNGFALATYVEDGEYSLYYEDGGMSKEYSLTAFQTIFARLGKGGVSGESVRFSGDDEDIDRIIKKLNIEIKDSQRLANLTTLYGYSARLGGGVMLDGQKINIQIVRKGNTVIIGTPLIMGSY